jgi:hypothetical protein
MTDFVNTFFEERVEQLFDLAALVERVFSSAGLDYRIVGGLAAYLYVEEREPDAGRLTKDIDIAVRRSDLDRIAQAAEQYGLQYRHVAGVDMLVQAARPSARRAIHLIFAGEKVRPDCRRIKGLRLISARDLVLMKLTRFRIVDQAHLKDLDQAGIITAEVEAGLSPELKEKLVQLRARD